MPLVGPIPYSITLDGRVYPVDLTQYSAASQDTLKPSFSTSDEPNDSMFSASGAWARYQYSWNHGMDQELRDLTAEADTRRFHDSEGINVWDDTGITMLKDGYLSRARPSFDYYLLHATNGYVFAALDTDLFVRGDFAEIGTGIWTTLTDPGGSVNAMSSDGRILYVATTTGLFKYDSLVPVAFTTPVTGDVTSVAFVANRLIIAKGNVLYEVAAAGTLTTLYTHQNPFFRWPAIFAIGSKIYVGGGTFARTELYTLTVSSTGTLVLGAEAASFPPYEQLLCATSSAGVVLFGTTAGVRLAVVGGDGTLTYGPLLSHLAQATQIAMVGRFAYVTHWTQDDSGVVQRAGLARVALDTFVAPLQPAFANDVLETTGIAVSVAIDRLGRLFWSGDQGIWELDPEGPKYPMTYVSPYRNEGWIESGLITFGTVESKMITSLEVVHDPLPLGCAVRAKIQSEDYVDLVTPVTNSTLGSTTTRVSASAQVRGCRVVLELLGPVEHTARVTSWRLRGYPIPPAVDQWIVPLIIQSNVVVGAGEGQQRSMNVIDETAYIRELQHTKELVNFKEGTVEHTVRVEAFEQKPAKWNSDGGFYESTLLVKLVAAP